MAVTREAEVILAQAAAAGVLEPLEALVAFVAREAGVDPEAILADAQRIGVRW